MKNDHKINKLLDKLEDRKYQVNNLIMRFVLVMVLIILFFISYEIYSYDYTPFVLSKLQYSYYKSDVNVPPSVNTGQNFGNNNGSGSGIGKGYIQTDVLGKCPSGYCAIDKFTGLKRCPNGNYSVTYNTVSEGCTRKEYCDIKALPYAVISNGATSLSGQCEPGVACRCIDKKSCNTGVTTIFMTIFGTAADVNGPASFLIDQQVNTSTEYGYTAIELQNPTNDFCQVNPGYTDRIIGGCTFQNSVREKLDCGNISSPAQSTKSSTGKLATVTFLQVDKGSTSFIVEKSNGATNYPIVNFKAPGYLRLSTVNNGTPIKELIRYNKILPYADIEGIFGIERTSSLITIADIIHISDSKDTGIFGQRSIMNTFPAQSQVNSFDFNEIYCTEQGDTNANFKNMLLCTQEDRQVCKQGVFSYNFNQLSEQNNSTNGILKDESFSRNFCQQSTNTLPAQTRQDYLEDPGFYTLSCYLGTGCSDKELNINGKKGLPAAAGKYYPDVDVGGISNTWETIVSSYPVFTQTSNSDEIIQGEGAIEPGDFWSLKSVSEILTTSEGSSVGTSTLYFNTLLGLDSYVGLGNVDTGVNMYISVGIGNNFEQYQILNCGHDYYDNFNKYLFTITLTENLKLEVSKNSGVEVYPIDFTAHGPETSMPLYGIITSSSLGHFNLADINGKKSDKNVISPLVIVIFKQFGFSGGNYNTIVDGVPDVSSGETYYRRVYASGTGSAASPALSLSQNKKIIPPQNISNLFLDQSNMGNQSGNLVSEVNAFQNSSEPFKIPLSMYYPVWNPVVFQQECIRCKPNLTAYVNLGSNENLTSVTIQYCGKDFQNYEYFIDSNGYHFTSFGTLDETQFNSTNKFHLKEPNNNIKLGDFVMSPVFLFTVSVKINKDPVGSAPYTNSLKLMRKLIYNEGAATATATAAAGIGGGGGGAIGTPSQTTYGIEESIHEQVIYDNQPIQDNGSLKLQPNPDGTYQVDLSDKPDGYLFGKLYQPVSNPDAFQNDIGFYLIPNVFVTDISADKKVITTNVQIPLEIDVSETKFGKYIQFCRLNKYLEIQLIENLGVNNTNGSNNVSGTDYELELSRISGGRITNITVTKGGTNFLQENLPIVSVANYDYYVE